MPIYRNGHGNGKRQSDKKKAKLQSLDLIKTWSIW